jgi:hypothetical protein
MEVCGVAYDMLAFFFVVVNCPEALLKGKRREPPYNKMYTAIVNSLTKWAAQSHTTPSIEG